MTTCRSSGATALALALLALSPPVLATLPPLRPLSVPVLDSMSESVQDQILRYQAEVTRLLADPETELRAAAEAFGDLGGLYVLYGLLANAVEALENARELDPGDFRWPYLLGFTHQTEGRLAQAAGEYRAALALREALLPAMLRLGATLLDMGQLEEAARLFEEALRRQPGSAAAHHGLARIAQANGNDEEAVDSFLRALDLQPGASSLRYSLAQSLRRLGRLEEAQEQLEQYGTGKVFIPDPVIRRLRGLGTGSAVHAVRGQRALDQGDIDTAIAEFRLATDADPDNAPARRALALALRQHGELGAAIAEYQAVLDLEPANPINHQDLALALSENGNHADAVTHFRRAIDLSPDYRDAYLGLGIALGRLGELDGALVQLDRAIALDPVEPSAAFERSMVLLRLGRTLEARDALEQLVGSHPDHAAARLGLARILELDGALEAARNQLERAWATSPPSQLGALVQLALGRIAERQGDRVIALEHYTRALEADADLLPARLRHAAMLAASGEYRSAASEYERLLLSQPDSIPVRLAAVSARVGAGEEGPAVQLLVDGLNRAPRAPRLAATLALLYAAGSDPSQRQPARARELAREAFSALNDTWSGEILALALAANGLFEEAVRAQERLVAALERHPSTDRLRAARGRLDSYRQREAPNAPWRQDPLLLPPAVLPLGALDSG